MEEMIELELALSCEEPNSAKYLILATSIFYFLHDRETGAELAKKLLNQLFIIRISIDIGQVGHNQLLRKLFFLNFILVSVLLAVLINFQLN
jgi:hypothetical protein